MPRISEMYAFVVADAGPEDEGIMAFCDPGSGMWTPMVGADRRRVESLIPVANDIAAVTGKPYKILRFTLAGEVQAPAKGWRSAR